MRVEVDVDTLAALRMARTLMAEHGLRGWRVQLDRAKTRAGVCRFRERTIGLSAPMTRLHTEAEVRDTILHEIAHALVGPEHGHDRVWRAQAKAIGCSGARCVPEDAARPEGPWRGVCPAGHVVTRHRTPSRVHSCSTCSRQFSPNHLIAWTYRGREIAMSAGYQEELAQLRSRYGNRMRQGDSLPGADSAVTTRHGDAAAAFELGASARIVTPGRWQGVTGVVESVGQLKVQIRVDQGVLAVPKHQLEPVGS